MRKTTVITDGNKAQADRNACEWYKLLNLHGQGEFVELLRWAELNKDYSEIDRAIRWKIRPYLYNNGSGKYVPVSQLVHVRRCYREGKPIKPTLASNRNLVASGKRRSNFIPTGSPVEPSENFLDIEAERQTPVSGEQPGGINSIPKSSGCTRFVCWDIYKRGAVGETMMHACLLLGRQKFTNLAKRLILMFPMLVYDIYVSDQYYDLYYNHYDRLSYLRLIVDPLMIDSVSLYIYTTRFKIQDKNYYHFWTDSPGESALHMAIVNEDAPMVNFILRSSQGRLNSVPCLGSFFSAADQRDSRIDRHDSDMIEVSQKTDYQGFAYWGDYPLSFAAGLGLEDCMRLLIAYGADCNAQDTNGNTVLHICVIYRQRNMFDLAYDKGAKLGVKNRQGLTPLTLAAELGRVEMFNHILIKERRERWIYGTTTCAEYPLCDIDSIDDEGNINTKSALYLIAYGKEIEHLRMVEGIIYHLLQAKWRSCVKMKYFQGFIQFSIFYAIFVTACLLRPDRFYITTPPTLYCNNSCQQSNTTDSMNTAGGNKVEVNRCYLLNDWSNEGYTNYVIRYVFELLAVIGAAGFLINELNRVRTQKWKIYKMSLENEPSSRIMLLLSCAMLITQVPVRLACMYEYEEITPAFIFVFMIPNFLFYCKGLKMIGPFALMIQKMITGDIVRFLIIYLVLLMGFAQAMFIVFFWYSGPDYDYFATLDGSIMALIYMTLGDFSKFYIMFDSTRHRDAGKLIFAIFMVVVYLMVINLLIAMMGTTYQLINDTENEYLRQWAQLVLATEYSVPKDERVMNRLKYSEPTMNAGRVMIVTWKQNSDEERQLQSEREKKRVDMKAKLIKMRSRHIQANAKRKKLMKTSENQSGRI